MFAWTESPRGSRPILLHLPHPLPEIPEDPPQPADPRSPDPGGAGADPSRRRRPGTLLPWEGILTTRPGVPGCDEHVWCGHGQKGRAVTSELATFGRDPAEQAGSGGRPSLLALGGAPSLRPCVLPPTGTMLSTGGQYAVKKRRKPVRKSPKLLPPEGAKSNPSKRHRDRLNQELSKLSRLLPFPEDVRARLDKLSILRLIVGYLKVKSYFTAALKDGSEGSSADPPMNPGRSEHPSLQVAAELCAEGDLLLQALDGFLVAVSEDGYVFYVSPTVQDYLGFHQSDVIHQSVFELLHKEDRALFQSQLLWPPGTAPISREGEHDTHPDHQLLEGRNLILSTEPCASVWALGRLDLCPRGLARVRRARSKGLEFRPLYTFGH